MGLQGEIGDVQVVDVMQFIHLGGRSGTLDLESPRGRAEIGFYRGQVVSARTAGAQRLGDVLLAVGAIDQAVLDQALRLQAIEEPRRALGQILLAQGAITSDTLYRALAEHLARAVQEVVAWSRGRFSFRPDDLRLIDGLALSPAELVAHVDCNTQMILLEALRLFDERSREDRDPAPAGAVGAATPAPAPAPATLRRPRVQLLTGDRQLGARLARVLGEDGHAVARVPARDAGAPPPGEPAPIVIVDARAAAGATPLGAIAHVARHRPRAPVVALVDDASAAGAAFEAGARAVVPDEPGALRACVRNLARDHAAGAADDAIDLGIRAGIGRLKRVLADLRAGLLSATMSLQLMSIISESVERAVFFLVRPGGLMALGAFGAGACGAPLAQVTQGLVLPRSGESLLTQVLADGHPRSTSFEDAHLPEALAGLLGRPATGQSVAFPVLGRQRAVAVIYTDNGRHQRVIDEIDVLELATAQVGMAFEAELLVRGGRPPQP
jgi:hypothetical protein